MDENNNKFLTFGLGEKSYAIPILKIKEIIGMMDITKIPRLPDYVKGVINLRGKIVPVIDLRLKFGLYEKNYHKKTSIIVVEINVDGTNMLSSIVVDSVNEVLDIEPCDVKPPSLDELNVEKEYLTGILKQNSSVIMLLDIVKLLSFKDSEKLK